MLKRVLSRRGIFVAAIVMFLSCAAALVVTALKPVLASISDYSEAYEIISSSYKGGTKKNAGYVSGHIRYNPLTFDNIGMSLPPDNSPSYAHDEGIEEGDIVKTDGEYIYTVQNEDLIVYQADGAETTVVFQTKIGIKRCRELYLEDDRLIVISDGFRKRDIDPEADYNYYNEKYTAVDFYDISDLTNPVLLSSLGQDGQLWESMLIDGRLYLISNRRLALYEFDEEHPDSYIPHLSIGTKETLFSKNDIIILPDTNTKDYTIIVTYDLKKAEVIDNLALLSGTTFIYMSSENLYIARQNRFHYVSEPYGKDGYTVVDHRISSRMDIIRFSLSKRSLSVAAYGSIPGSIRDSLSLNEYKGRLRTISSKHDFSSSTYTDSAGVEYGRNVVSADHIVLSELDSNLKIINSAEYLAEGESVYSVTFDEDLCCFSTVESIYMARFAQTRQPEIIASHKTDGYYEHLYHINSNLILGVGLKTEYSFSNFWGMKLAMFDVTNSGEINIQNTSFIETTLDTNLLNNNGVLISKEKCIFAFPTVSDFNIIGYTSEAGFENKLKLVTQGLKTNARALDIGDYIYIVSTNGILVFDSDTFDNVPT